VKTILIFICILFLCSAVSAAYEETIVVGHCNIRAIVMETPQEHSKGLLGYTERTFPYDAMLFQIGGRNQKYFHTIGMQMNIRIMGVMKSSTGSYRVLNGIIKAPPGISQIPIDASDVLEIPEGKYQLNFKRCLGASEIK
jgi:hypothetical protein